MLQKLSIKTGFTKTEIKVIGFLLFTLAAGFSYVTFFEPRDNTGYKRYDYSVQDSLFLSSGGDEDSSDFIETVVSEDNSSSADILELSKKNFHSIPPKELPAEKSINLNTANIELLIKLPGIGKKTADKVIELRKRLRKFSSIEQLLLVKGIGDTKLAKIKKYIFIE